ncbi:flagellar basal body P-ring formation chaperone FlgA [Morganella morganii]|uniref:flagellar basal body P-ring formation chaperone FlgA n=1 Tax=Morganella morganii TaxID=582 RepID=UPI0021CE1FE0|nr:flagellar basal body P-ring formation chaperone FlgA [Morganella morganii]
MDFRLIRYFLLLTIPFSLPAFPASEPSAVLEKNIQTLIGGELQKNTVPDDDLRIKILSSGKQLESLCDNPVLSLSGQNSKITGNRTVLARCGKKSHYIRINVSVTGTYWVAGQALLPGEAITAAQLELRTGSLDGLPADIITDPQQITDKIPTRLIKSGQPVTAGSLRKTWSVLTGDEISVVASGNGFQVTTVGKSMDNGALGDAVRFRTRSGQILTGKVTGKKKVTINMQN